MQGVLNCWIFSIEQQFNLVKINLLQNLWMLVRRGVIKTPLLKATNVNITHAEMQAFFDIAFIAYPMSTLTLWWNECLATIQKIVRFPTFILCTTSTPMFTYTFQDWSFPFPLPPTSLPPESFPNLPKSFFKLHAKWRQVGASLLDQFPQKFSNPLQRKL